MKRNEQVLLAMNGIGDDLIVMAEQQTFSRSPWQKILPAAACLVLILGAAVTLRHLTAAPVQPEPAQETVLEAPAEVAPAERSLPGEDVTYTITEEALEPFTRELSPQTFYIYDPDPENRNSPCKAIAPDGTVLVEVENGSIEPLIDEETGEYIAILVYQVPDGSTILSYSCDIYNLEGEKVVDQLPAYQIDCLGNTILVMYTGDVESKAALYRRDTRELLRDDFGCGFITGDCIWMMPPDYYDGEIQYLVDREGNLTMAETWVDGYFVWQNRTYIITRPDKADFGLMDSYGVQLIANQYDAIYYGIKNGYAICADDNGHYLVDIQTGEEVFHWDYVILDACDDYVTVLLEGGEQALVDWNGKVLVTGTSIESVDDDADGKPELFVVAREDGMIYLNASGDVLAATSSDRDVIENYITSRTVVTLRPLEDGEHEITIVDLTTGARKTLDRAYTSILPIWEDDQATGLFYAGYLDEAGQVYSDIIREDGTVLLSGVRGMWTLQGDVFYMEQDGVSGLIRLDGTWLYQE